MTEVEGVIAEGEGEVTKVGVEGEVALNASCKCDPRRGKKRSMVGLEEEKKSEKDNEIDIIERKEPS